MLSAGGQLESAVVGPGAGDSESARDTGWAMSSAWEIEETREKGEIVVVFNKLALEAAGLAE